MMKCYIGIDGGGTKSFLRAVDECGNILVESTGESTNICSNSTDIVYENLQSLWKDTLAAYGRKLEPIGLCLGSAGMSKHGSFPFFMNSLRMIFSCEKIRVISDIELTLGLPDQINVVSITSGTGSVCIARNKYGKLFRGGGYGHILGDEGSGYSIGIAAIKHVLRAYDLLLDDNFTKEIFNNSIFHNITDILEYVYSNQFNKKNIASLSKIVSELALQGDNTSKVILNNAIDHLVDLVERVCNASGLKNEPFMLSLWGGILNNCTYVSESLVKKLYEKYQIEHITLNKDICWNAVEIAKSI